MECIYVVMWSMSTWPHYEEGDNFVAVRQTLTKQYLLRGLRKNIKGARNQTN